MRARIVTIVLGFLFIVSSPAIAQQVWGVYLGGSFFFSKVESHYDANYFKPFGRIPSPFIAVENVTSLKNSDYAISTRLKTTYISQLYSAPMLYRNIPSSWLRETHLVKGGNVDLNATIEKTVLKSENSKLNIQLGAGIESVFYNKKTYEIAAKDTIRSESYIQLGTEVVNFSPTLNAGVIYRLNSVNNSLWNFGMDFTWAMRKNMGTQQYTYGKGPEFVDEGKFVFGGSKVSVNVGYSFGAKRK